MTAPRDARASTTSRKSFLAVRWLWVVIVTAAVMLGTVAADKLQHRSYASTASVAVSPQMFADGAEPLPADLGTAKVVGTSTVVLRPVAHELGLSLAQLRADIAISNPANTNVLVFTSTATTPALAQRLADAVAAAFCAYQNKPLAAVVKQQAIVATGGHSSSSLSVEPAKIITPATLPGSPAGHKLVLDLLVALIAGLGLGLATALLVDRSSSRIRDGDDVGAIVEIPVLADVPAPRWNERPAVLSNAIASDRDLLATYRSIRVRLQEETSPGGPLVVLVTRVASSCLVEVPTSVGLAVSFALSGEQVILVGADMEATRISGVFCGQGVPGLAELLRDPSRKPSLVSTTVANLTVLPEGLALAGAEEYVSRPRLVEALEMLESFGPDVIVVDGPLLSAPERVALASCSNVALVEIDPRQVRRSDLRDAADALASTRSTLVGAIITRTRRHAHHRRQRAREHSTTEVAAPRALEVANQFARSNADPVVLTGVRDENQNIEIADQKWGA